MSPVLIPLGVFLAVALLVAVTNVSKIRDKEMEVGRKLQAAESKHRQKMQELEAEILRIQQRT